MWIQTCNDDFNVAEDKIAFMSLHEFTKEGIEFMTVHNVHNLKKGKINERGFSLVEVLMAIVLLGLIAAPILQMFYSSYSVNLKSRKYLAAADLLQTVMEGISSGTWEDSPTVDGTVTIAGIDDHYRSINAANLSEVHPLFAEYNSTTKTYISESDITGHFMREETDAVTITGEDGTKTTIPRKVDVKVVNIDKSKCNGYPFILLISFTEPEKKDKYYTVKVDVSVCDADETVIQTATTYIPNKR